MPHFFINSKDVVQETITITDENNYKHIAKALRIKAGEKLLLIDENEIQYETIVEEIDNKKILTHIENSYKSSRKLDFEIHLAQSPLHSDRQSSLVEKATELGIHTLHPIFTENCTVNKTVIEKKIPKWQKIMSEASKQCERANIPTCAQAKTLEQVINNEKFDKIIVFCERYTQKTIRQSFMDSPVSKGQKILVIIGPEGGFSQNEFNYFKEHNFEMLTLGQLILRAETAVTVGIGNIIYEYSVFNK